MSNSEKYQTLTVNQFEWVQSTTLERSLDTSLFSSQPSYISPGSSPSIQWTFYTETLKMKDLDMTVDEFIDFIDNYIELYMILKHTEE